MLKSLVVTAIRNILKDKVYSLINMIGLTIGITCGLFLLLYILDELSFDQYHENADQIYRVVSHIEEPDKAFKWGVTQLPTGPTLKEEYPFVKNYARFIPAGRSLFREDDEGLYMDGVYLADSTVFEMFSYNMLEGDPSTALDDPNCMVITRDMAIRYFGEESAFGKSLTSESGNDYKITGVIENVPLNSHFRFNALLSLPNEMRSGDNWGSFYVTTYLQIADEQNAKALEGLLPTMYDKYMANIFEQMDINIQYHLQQLPSIHLYSQMESEDSGNISYLYIFAVVALFMILIASINYMNLATARSTKRAREVGVRKVMGSHKSQLIVQFLTESLVITSAALLMSLVLIVALLPSFNELAGKQISIEYLIQPNVLSSIILILLLVGVLGGSYPAFVLSSFQPVNVLKGKVTTGKNSAVFRKVLVVAQFAISLAMLVSTWIVYDQLTFMREKDLGYDKNQVLTVGLNQQDIESYPVFRNEILKNPKVRAVGTASSRTSNINSRVIFNVESTNGMEEKAFRPMTIDHDFVETMNMTLVEGRNFSEDIPADTLLGVMVNEETVRRMNWENPLGKKVMVEMGRDGEYATASVVGVLKDFHQQSLHSIIEPMVLTYDPTNRVIHIKLETEQMSRTVGELENTWHKLFSGKPFEYSFLDQDFQNAYEADARRGEIFTIFSVLTILIACLGLLGLASYAAEKRTKEIGVRKVIGASSTGIVFMMTKDFMILVAIAMLIAFPTAWYFMDGWLDMFAYKTNIHWSTFLFSALLTWLLTFVTVSYHTIRAANTNPVNSLRSE